jgi:hypothetical protein
VQKRFQGFEEPRIRVITTRPFDKLRVTEEKGSRIRGFKDARAKVQKFKVQKFKVQKFKVQKFKVQKFKVQSWKSKSAGFKLQT